jgi:hypothetical protein
LIAWQNLYELILCLELIQVNSNAVVGNMRSMEGSYTFFAGEIVQRNSRSLSKVESVYKNWSNIAYHITLLKTASICDWCSNEIAHPFVERITMCCAARGHFQYM